MEHQSPTTIVTPEFQKDLALAANHQNRKSRQLKIAAGALAGIGAAAAMMSFSPAPIDPEKYNENDPIPLPDNPEETTVVRDDMSFQDAFAAAREAAGPGATFQWHGKVFSTYYSNEWDQLSRDEQLDFTHSALNLQPENRASENRNSFNIYEKAPVATHTDDEMSFRDAFAVARQEVGGGGIFDWHGRTYHTYTRGEWSRMSAEDRLLFRESASNPLFAEDYEGSEDFDEVNFDNADTETQANAYTDDEFLGTRTVSMDGEEVTVGIYLHNGTPEIRIDADQNGTYEYAYDGDSSQIVDIHTGEPVLGNNLAPNSEIPVRSDEIMIDGHMAWVTAFEDGRVEANVDTNDDGTPDSLVSLNPSGHMQLFNSQGELVHEEQIDPSLLNTMRGESTYNEDPSLNPIHFVAGSMVSNDNDFSAEHNVKTEQDDTAHQAAKIEHTADTPLPTDDTANTITHNDYYPDDTAQHDAGFDNQSAVDDWV